jgi:hypothetical protein
MKISRNPEGDGFMAKPERLWKAWKPFALRTVSHINCWMAVVSLLRWDQKTIRERMSSMVRPQAMNGSTRRSQK